VCYTGLNQQLVAMETRMMGLNVIESQIVIRAGFFLMRAKSIWNHYIIDTQSHSMDILLFHTDVPNSMAVTVHIHGPPFIGTSCKIWAKSHIYPVEKQ
jgi:hypothetical protein